MSDKPTLTEQAVDLGKPLVAGAVNGSVPSTLIFYSLLVALLVAWWIRHRANKPERDDGRILAELQSIRDAQAKSEAAMVRLHERLDKADDKFVSRGEFTAFLKNFDHFEEELRVIIENAIRSRETA